MIYDLEKFKNDIENISHLSQNRNFVLSLDHLKNKKYIELTKLIEKYDNLLNENKDLLLDLLNNAYTKRKEYQEKVEELIESLYRYISDNNNHRLPNQNIAIRDKIFSELKNLIKYECLQVDVEKIDIVRRLEEQFLAERFRNI
jgi:transcriptional regulator NrdR family protein